MLLPFMLFIFRNCIFIYLCKCFSIADWKRQWFKGNCIMGYTVYSLPCLIIHASYIHIFSNESYELNHQAIGLLIYLHIQIYISGNHSCTNSWVSWRLRLRIQKQLQFTWDLSLKGNVFVSTSALIWIKFSLCICTIIYSGMIHICWRWAACLVVNFARPNTCWCYKTKCTSFIIFFVF